MLSFDFRKKIFLLDSKEVELSGEQATAFQNLKWWHGVPLSTHLVPESNHQALDHLYDYFPDPTLITDQDVLVIGYRDGFLMFLAEACGAKTVSGLDDMPAELSLEPSYKFCKKVLRSRSSVISIENLIGDVPLKFDTVIIHDSITRDPNPLILMELATKICKKNLIVLSSVIWDEVEFGWSLSHKNFFAPASFRHYFTPNKVWLENNLTEVGFKITRSQYWGSNKNITLVCEPSKTDPLMLCSQEKDLPDDQGEENKTAVLVMSCKKFEQLWDPFFKLFNKYWPDCPYKIYFCSDQGRYNSSEIAVENIEIGSDKGWASNCKEALRKITAERIILFQEDFFINGPFQTTRIRKLVKHAHEHNVACLRLTAAPEASGPWKYCNTLGAIGQTDDYRVSLQLAIWSKSVFDGLLKEGSNPWEVEVEGSLSSIFIQQPFLTVNRGEVPAPYFMTAVVRGEWVEGALELLRKENIPTEHIRRKL